MSIPVLNDVWWCQECKQIFSYFSEYANHPCYTIAKETRLNRILNEIIWTNQKICVALEKLEKILNKG
jgi:hypothetical protein